MTQKRYNMKKIVFVAVMLVTCFATMGREVGVDKACSVAGKFLQQSGIEITGPLEDISAKTPYTEFYTFEFNHGGGFILISADDCVVPVLGYSTQGGFEVENTPIHVKQWLEEYENQIRFYKEHQDGTNSEVASQWKGKWVSKNGGKSVKAMVVTQWNQTDPYNRLCPILQWDTEHALTGCTATALAQILRYWRYPEMGYGSHTYRSKIYDTLSADFGATTYYWDSMPNKLTAYSSEGMVNAVATLMFHCGVSIDMDYSTASSGAFTVGYGRDTLRCAEYALVENFKYKNTLRGMFADDFPDDEWIARLKHEFDNKRPVIYTGYSPSAGHAFVADGYDDKDYVHINWGWAGSYDGYFKMGHLNPGAGSGSNPGASSQGTYNLQCSALMGIMPNDNFGHGDKVEVTSEDESMGTVTGGGTYDFGQLVTLWANAKEGHRFVRWSDGNCNNPRRFTATGCDHTLEARFEPLHPDTLTYCTSNLWFGNLGKAVDHKYWGVRYPVSTLKKGYQMKSVHFFAVKSANYDVEVFEGSVSDEGLRYSKEVFVSKGKEQTWMAVDLDSALSFSGSQPVWVRLHSKGVEKTAVYTASSGNIDSRLWGETLSGDTMGNQSWMIRSVFQHPDSVNVEIRCSGAGEVVYGDSEENVTNKWITVTPNELITLHFRKKGGDLLGLYLNEVDYKDSLTVETNGYQLSFSPKEYTVVRAVFDGWNSINDVEGSFIVTVKDRRIVVTGADDREVRVFDLSGRETYNPTEPLMPGIYMVQVGNGPASKVVVM